MICLNEIFGTGHPVALVTGSGANRVGRVIARRLVESGYRVVLHANRSKAEAEAVCAQWRAEGYEVNAVFGSIEDEPTIGEWIRQIITEFGGLHVLVNSAAEWEPTRLEALDAKALHRQWQTNLMGPALLCRAAGLAMQANAHGGAIVNIGDCALLRPYVDFAAYLLSKGGIRTLTEVMAVELAERNPSIRVNAVFPGPVMLDERVTSQAREKIIQQSLLKRQGSPGDVASAVQFLAESPFITGVCLPVDGGRSIYAGVSSDATAHPTYDPRNFA